MPDKGARRNIFVVVEGLDNVGKTTVCRLAADALKDKGESAVYVKTPPDAFRAVAAVVNESATRDAHYLFHLAGVKFAEAEIALKLSKQTVICDRYYYSTIAYHQGAGSQLPIQLSDVMAVQPDFAFLLIASETERMRRAREKSHPTKGDLETKTSAPLLLEAERILRSMPLEIIDTTALSAPQVAATIVSAVAQRRG
jgi:thymidylate kinase